MIPMAILFISFSMIFTESLLPDVMAGAVPSSFLMSLTLPVKEDVALPLMIYGRLNFEL